MLEPPGQYGGHSRVKGRRYYNMRMPRIVSLAALTALVVLRLVDHYLAHWTYREYLRTGVADELEQYMFFTGLLDFAWWGLVLAVFWMWFFDDDLRLKRKEKA